MELTAELHGRYREFFKTEEQLEKVFIYGEEYLVQQSNITELNSVLENCLSDGYTYVKQDEFFTIEGSNFTFKIAVLPTSDCAFYAINKSKNNKSSYEKRAKLSVFLDFLVDRGIIISNEYLKKGVPDVLHSAVKLLIEMGALTNEELLQVEDNSSSRIEYINRMYDLIESKWDDIG